ncbi:hypothetical protein [Sphingomonas sp.]|uniref:hypothetical protein n=1 Tax=Sphingomonas sp. TaxID=28214 RepID=UPI001D5E9C82|nr:hypothetical protein [Sphingomonas sp.]MBX9797232.1 hypothetical protein [Sphingomonas sp.]
MIALLLAAQAVEPVAPRQAFAERYERCLDLATDDPGRGIEEATDWRIKGGRHYARQCLGMAYANLNRWTAAATEFTEAAREAEVDRDVRAARYWAQAGNAWLATGDAAKARAALDAALASGNLVALQLGEARLDRARALVLLGELAAARTDIDKAKETAAKDPLLWLASATLARRMGDLPLAKADAIKAHGLAPDDASVLVEIGNIAASEGDATGAQAAWREAIARQPGSDAANSAEAALRQFEDPPPP